MLYMYMEIGWPLTLFDLDQNLDVCGWHMHVLSYALYWCGSRFKYLRRYNNKFTWENSVWFVHIFFSNWQVQYAGDFCQDQNRGYFVAFGSIFATLSAVAIIQLVSISVSMKHRSSYEFFILRIFWDCVCDAYWWTYILRFLNVFIYFFSLPFLFGDFLPHFYFFFHLDSFFIILFSDKVSRCYRIQIYIQQVSFIHFLC